MTKTVSTIVPRNDVAVQNGVPRVRSLFRRDDNFWNRFNELTIGFDDFFAPFDSLFERQKSVSFPAYNIVKLPDDKFQITMAVAGYTENDLTVNTVDDTLVVRGQIQTSESDGEQLHRGIAARSFERSFQLAAGVEVTKVTLKYGILTIELKQKLDLRTQCIPHTINVE